MLLNLESQGFGRLVSKNSGNTKSGQMVPRSSDVFMKPFPERLPLEHFAFKVGNVSRTEYGVHFREVSNYSEYDMKLLKAFHPDYELFMNTLLYGKQSDTTSMIETNQELISVSRTASHRASYSDTWTDSHLPSVHVIKKEPIGH